MANATQNPHLQDLGAGDELALALKEYGGMLLTAFKMATVFMGFGIKKTITSGSSHQFPATWKMTAEEHNAGVELQGDEEPLSEERLINVDTKELVAHDYINPVQDFIAHFDTRSERAIQAARAIGCMVDSRLARVAILGARQAARGPANEFPAGNTLTTPRAGPVTDAYPISLAGSQFLQCDLAEIAQKMDEKDVPRDNRATVVTPYLERVLRQDNTLLSRDYQDPNSKLTRRVVMVEGFRVESSNNLPSTLVAGETNANYNDDFTLTAAVCLGDPTAFGQVSFGGIVPFGPTWIDDKRSHLIGAAFLQGCKWLRPEACGEIGMA